VDKAGSALALSCRDEVAGSALVDTQKLGLVAGPDKTRQVIDDLLTLARFVQRWQILDIAGDCAHTQLDETGGLVGGAHQRRHHVTPLDEALDQMGADKPGTAGD
jgi:hypothetical protein